MNNLSPSRLKVIPIKISFGLFLAALLIRLIVMGFSVDQLGVAGLAEYSPDVRNYLSAGREIAESLNFGTLAVNTFGPGYPLYLGFVTYITGFNLVVFTILNLILSSLSVILVSRFGAMTTGDYRIGICAGVLMALSPTSIGLSSSLLSETLFVFLLLAGLVWFVEGLQKDKLLYFVSSGLILGYAALTRSMGQMIWVLLLVATVWHYWPSDKFDLKKIFIQLKMPLIAILIMLVIMFSWVIRNNVELGHSSLSLSQATGFGKATCLARARRTDQPLLDVWRAYQAELADSLKRSTVENKVTSAEVSRKLMFHEFGQGPFNCAIAFLSNMNDQVHNSGLMMSYTVPDWKNQINRKMGWLKSRWYFHVLSFMAMLGGIILYRRGNRVYSVMLLLIGAYFAVLSGFTFWQTRRIYFPSQVATTILVSVSIMAGYDWLMERFKGRKMIAEILDSK